MIPDRVKPGASFTAYTDFLDDSSNPVVFTQAVGYAIRDLNKNLITSGVAAQTNKAERWQTDISLPATLSPGNYSITWSGKNSKQVLQNSEEFTVVNSTPNYYELDLLVLEKSILTDTLKLNSSEALANYNVNVLTPQGDVIFTDDFPNPTPIHAGDDVYYNFNSAVPLTQMLAGASAFALYIIEWKFIADGQSQTEHHFVYVVNHKALAYINELKRMIDKANIQNPNPNLRYNNVDLLASLNMGIQYINAQPPTQTNFTLSTIPDVLYSYVLYAAAISALESRYNAEAEAAFNFNGQPITLDVDRTGFIESAIGRYQAKLDDLKSIKKGIVMSGSGIGVGSGGGGSNSAGIVSYSIGPTLTLSPFGFNSRMPFYYGILGDLGYAI